MNNTIYNETYCVWTGTTNYTSVASNGVYGYGTRGVRPVVILPASVDINSLVVE